MQSSPVAFGRGFSYVQRMKAMRQGTDRERLELALQIARLGEFEWDIDRDVFIISPRLADITGLTAGEIPAEAGGALERHIHPDDLEMIRGDRAQRLETADTYERRYRLIRPDNGQVLWMRSASRVIRDATGKARRVCGILEDVSQDHLEEDQRQQLMAELDHRVKNVLATVQALAMQTAKRTTSLDGFLQTFGGRL
jgi:PAS domain S-box-containing protein